MRHLMLVLVMGLVFGEEPAPKTLGEAEMQFNREFNTAKEQFDKSVDAAKVKFVLFLKEEMKRLTAKGDLDGAVAVREKIKNMEPENNNVVKNDTKTEQKNKYNFQKIIGEYTTPKAGPWSIKNENGNISLTETKTGYSSQECTVINNVLLFKWSNHNAMISVTVNPDGMVIAMCGTWPQGGPREVPQVTDWKFKMTKVK